MNRTTEIGDRDATGQAEAVRRREVSPRELVDEAIRRIERLNPRLNAVIHEHFARARTEADGPLPDGPFRGVPFLLKDLGGGTRAGDPIHWGTRFLKDAGYRAPVTSYLVEKFMKAGLVIVGRTNVPELGAWTTTEPEAYGPTRNPWNPEHSSGGSSGGAAAAVASRMVAAAHASDGGGSIRIPASECGLVGLKPSRGRISMGPAIGEMWAGMAFELAVTRSIRDAAGLLDAVAGAMPGDPYVAELPLRPYAQEVGAPTGTLRVGLMPAIATAPVHADCAAAVERAGRLLADFGHHVEVAHPQALEDPAVNGAVIRVIATSQAHAIDHFGALLGRPLGAADMDCDNWAITEMGRKVSGPQYLAALAVLHEWNRRMASFWSGGFDLLVTPTIPVPPPRLGEQTPDPSAPLSAWARAGVMVAFTAPFNVTGQPAMSLPLHWSDAGLPIGVQFVAGFGREDVLIRVGAQLEAAACWAERRPPISA
ncbi:MAG: amidase [Deltaproteobacteria bacterium]|nr:amidase [Deltaproteobacteria bacterium]